jgi:hypothetical protein
MICLDLVGHRRREVKVGRQDEVDHRNGDCTPCAVVGYRHAPFAVDFESDAQFFGEHQAGTACVVRLGKDGVHETAGKVLLCRLLCEFVAGCEGVRMNMNVRVTT